MRKFMILAAVVVFGVLAATAFARNTVHTVTSKASVNKAGTKAKPEPFVAYYKYTAVESNGLRAATPVQWSWKWNGVVANQGDKFPICTAQQVDTAQSDSVCPKGSLVATTPAEFLAKLGPESDPSSSVSCNKRVNMYNAGKGKAIWVIVGPAAKCAGVAYLPPVPITLKTSGDTTTFGFTFAENITHPLPGIEGGIVSIDWQYKKLTKKVGGKTIGYLQSTGCGKSKTRTFTYTVKDADGNTTTSAKAGTCK